MSNYSNISGGKKRGFTFIELMVVISIIALLSSILLASLQAARQRAQTSAKSETVHQIINALEEYSISNNGYYPLPASPSGITTCDERSAQCVVRDDGTEQCIELNSTGSCMWGSSNTGSQGLSYGQVASNDAAMRALGAFYNISTLPIDNVTGDSGENWGGIAYLCLTPDSSDTLCKTYALEWVAAGINNTCNGGTVADTADSVGEGIKNTYCMYTNDPVNGYNDWYSNWY